MEPILQIDAAWNHGVLHPGPWSFDTLFRHVMQNGLAVLHGVFPERQLIALRQDVHAWGSRTEMRPPQTSADDNFHAVEAGISPRQKTPHCYHAYNFNRLDAALELAHALRGVFEPLRSFQNALTGNAATYQPDANGRRARPQIIHYPSGGGMFGRHTHPLEPQRIGLILGLSQRGTDFRRGSTHFDLGGRHVSTEAVHDLGDMILFRFDIPHWISTIDEGEPMDLSTSRGRWTAVLPYY